MKKILLIAFMFVSFVGYSQVISDTTRDVSTEYYKLSWDSSYQVTVTGGHVLVSFKYEMEKYIDGILTKRETHNETKDITDSAALVNLVLSPTIVGKFTGLLENRKKQLVK